MVWMVAVNDQKNQPLLINNQEPPYPRKCFTLNGTEEFSMTPGLTLWCGCCSVTSPYVVGYVFSIVFHCKSWQVWHWSCCTRRLSVDWRAMCRPMSHLWDEQRFHECRLNSHLYNNTGVPVAQSCGTVVVKRTFKSKMRMLERCSVRAGPLFVHKKSFSKFAGENLPQKLRDLRLAMWPSSIMTNSLDDVFFQCAAPDFVSAMVRGLATPSCSAKLFGWFRLKGKSPAVRCKHLPRAHDVKTTVSCQTFVSSGFPGFSSKKGVEVLIPQNATQLGIWGSQSQHEEWQKCKLSLSLVFLEAPHRSNSGVKHVVQACRHLK